MLQHAKIAFLFGWLLVALDVVYQKTTAGVEASPVSFNLISTGSTLAIAPYTSFDAPNHHACVSRCHYQPGKCFSFDFEEEEQTSDSKQRILGRCNLYDVHVNDATEHSLERVSKTGVSLYSKALTIKNCADWYNLGYRASKVYEINVWTSQARSKLRVFCNMEENGGGWLVFQRRFDGSESFERTWEEYKHGFGDVENEHWLGNKWLNLLTNSEVRQKGDRYFYLFFQTVYNSILLIL